MTYGIRVMHRRASQFLMILHEKTVSRLCLIVLSSALVFLFLGRMEQAQAGPERMNVTASLAMLQLGTVTTNQEGGDLFIDDKRYSVLPSAIVSDDEGQPRALKEFVRGTLVRFHLRNGTIDQLVLMLPR